MNEEIIKNMNYDKYLDEKACKNSDAIRLKNEECDFRPPYFRDADRIIHSLSYNRYIDKTQVFSQLNNDHISRRMTHVQLVSKIGRTIGRALNLNEDLIEAGALGHDIGHVPFGHVGESILNEISLNSNQGYFNHNVQSVRQFLEIEKNGEGLNLTLQVLDAILCHNGELELKKYMPVKKSKEDFLIEYKSCYEDPSVNSKLIPMTLEGCVVRISDIIAYLGRDIEDAVILGKFNIEDIPSSITNILGNSNKSIVNTLITDIIINSYKKDYIAMSDKVFNALKELKKFNYLNIYSKSSTSEDKKYWKECFNTVYKHSLAALKIDDYNAPIYKVFLNNMNENYLKNTSNERKVIDYIAGMTDDYLLNEVKNIKRLTI